MSLTEYPFFNKHIFIHTHIEKCGGSTLVYYLETLFGKNYVCDLRPYPAGCATEILKNYPDIQNQLRHSKLLSGHIHYDTPWAKKIPKNQWIARLLLSETSPYYYKKPLYIASIRHPIDRLISLFRYVRSRPKHPLYDDHIKNNDMDGFIQHLIQTDYFRMNNEICTVFIGRRDSLKPLDDAKHAFDTQYFSVVPYNKTHELAHMLSAVFQLPLVTKSLINPSNPEETATPCAETRALLEEKCQNDILFYHYMMSHYQEKLAQARRQLEDIYGGLI
jgi:hypothetical protein